MLFRSLFSRLASLRVSGGTTLGVSLRPRRHSETAEARTVCAPCAVISPDPVPFALDSPRPVPSAPTRAVDRGRPAPRPAVRSTALCCACSDRFERPHARGFVLGPIGFIDLQIERGARDVSFSERPPNMVLAATRPIHESCSSRSSRYWGVTGIRKRGAASLEGRRFHVLSAVAVE